MDATAAPTEEPETQTETAATDARGGASASSGGGGVTDPAETSEAADPNVGSAAADREVVPWNGALEKIEDQPWFKGLTEAERENVRGGIKDIYDGWQRTYVSKFSEIRKEGETLRAKIANAEALEQKARSWLYGDSDPVSELKQEIETLKANHAVALDALKGEYAKAVEEIKTSSGRELQEAVQARDEALKRIQAVEAEQQKLVEAEAEAQADALESFLKEEAAPVLENDQAFNTWAGLVSQGWTKEQAVAATKQRYPELFVGAPAKPEKPTPPAAVKTMSLGSRGGNTASGQTKSFDQLMDEMRRAAQRR